MSSILKVDTIQDQDGNNIINESGDTITIGASGDTITIPSGATIDTSGATLTLPTTIEVDTIEPKTATTLTLGASGDTITIPSGATITNNGTATGFGKVLQVVGTQTSTSFSTSSTSMVDVTGYSLSITPSSSSNKILVLVNFRYGCDTSSLNACQLLRNSDVISFGGVLNLSNVLLAHGSAAQGFGSFGVNYLDAPNSTSALTYKLQVSTSAGTLYVNNRNDGNATANCIGSFTLMEIAG